MDENWRYPYDLRNLEISMKSPWKSTRSPERLLIARQPAIGLVRGKRAVANHQGAQAWKNGQNRDAKKKNVLDGCE